MSIVELIILALGLSMDAFAVSICMGLSTGKSIGKTSVAAGLYFGAFQALMPLIGYLAGVQFADKIMAFDHWIAFLLLAFIGGKMIIGSLDRSCPEPEEVSLGPKKMLPLALATSIDALAIGVSFAFLNVSILPAVSLIGAVTLVTSMIGVRIGYIFGARFKTRAELLGGVILVLIGFKILLEHLGIINF